MKFFQFTFIFRFLLSFPIPNWEEHFYCALKSHQADSLLSHWPQQFAQFPFNSFLISRIERTKLAKPNGSSNQMPQPQTQNENENEKFPKLWGQSLWSSRSECIKKKTFLIICGQLFLQIFVRLSFSLCWKEFSTMRSFWDVTSILNSKDFKLLEVVVRSLRLLIICKLFWRSKSKLIKL